jgi:NADPH:quinone reductase-like Zn-dependent oxidoreductase
MRVIVTGDRAWECHELAADVVRRLMARHGQRLVIVHGAAGGVGAAFAEAARALGVAVEPHRAEWVRLGKRAGPSRNQRMVDAGADLCVAVHRFIANSKGTKDCARRAIAAGIPTYLIDGEDARPARLLADDARLARDLGPLLPLA